MSTQDIPELYSDYKEALKQLSELTEEEVAFNKSAVKAKNEIYRKRIELIQKRELIQYFLNFLFLIYSYIYLVLYLL